MGSNDGQIFSVKVFKP